MADFGSDTAQTARQAAEVVLNALQADSPALRTQTSPWADGLRRHQARPIWTARRPLRDQHLGGLTGSAVGYGPADAVGRTAGHRSASAPARRRRDATPDRRTRSGGEPGRGRSP